MRQQTTPSNPRPRSASGRVSGRTPETAAGVPLLRRQGFSVAVMVLQAVVVAAILYLPELFWLGLVSAAAALATCGVIVTGPVYEAETDPDTGARKVWPRASKVRAVLLLFAFTLAFAGLAYLRYYRK